MYKAWVEALRNYRASDTEIIIVVLFLVGMIAYFILHNWWDYEKSRVRRTRNALQAFLAICRAKGLIEREMKLIRDYAVKIGQIVDPGLVESNVIFDQFAERVLQTTAGVEKSKVNDCFTDLRYRLGFRPPPRGMALNSTRELPVGQLLYLILPSDKFFEGRIIAIDETRMIVRIWAGMEFHTSVFAEMQVQLYFNRIGDARYTAPCKILKTISDEEGQQVILNHTDRLRRDQRRQDFRVEEDRIISLWIIDRIIEEAEDPIRALEDRIPNRARLEDLSGGGASIIFSRDLPVNQGVFINLDPARLYNLPIVRGTVVRTSSRGRVDRWALSVRFEDLRPSEHQRLVHHIFKLERDQLKIA